MSGKNKMRKDSKDNILKKPKLRMDARINIFAALTNSPPIYQSCLNCDHFNEQSELCKLANQRPPAIVIAYSCNSWDDKDDIPF